MNPMRLPITTLLLLLLLVSIPGLSLATPSSADDPGSSDSTSTSNSTSTKTSSGDSEEDLGDVILVAIYSLGGLLDFGGNGGDGATSGGLTESDLRLPPTGSIDGDGNLSSPVPEPTGALLFGFGILAVAARRPRTD